MVNKILDLRQPAVPSRRARTHRLYNVQDTPQADRLGLLNVNQVELGNRLYLKLFFAG
jgi:hypothetical protein